MKALFLWHPIVLVLMRGRSYYGKVIRLLGNQNSARVRRFEDNAISIESLEPLLLETEVPNKNKSKFQKRIKSVNVNADNNIEFEHTESTPVGVVVDQIQVKLSPQERIAPVDSSTPGKTPFLRVLDSSKSIPYST